MLASPFHYQSQQTPATSHFHHQTREFLPKIPSPLSPRSANINGSGSGSFTNRTQQPDFMSSENYDASTTQKPQNSFTFNAPAPQPLPYSKRAIKRAPAVSQDALTERRRGMFLKKVREGREDKRFERHGEDIMRLDFVQRQKKWEAEQARVAHSLPLDAPEEEEDGLDGEGSWGLPGSSGDAMQMSSQWDATPEEADEVARRESEELEELLSLLPGDASGSQYQHQQQEQQQEYHQTHQAQRQEDHFGSDDDDYDALFSDFINEEAHGMPEEDDNTHTAPSGDDAMDMS